MRSLPKLGQLLAALLATTGAAAFEYNTFDGPGFPSCYNVSRVHDAVSVADMAAVVKEVAATAASSSSGTSSAAVGRVRAAGKGHMWYDTQCSDAWTVVVRTEQVNAISEFELPEGAERGTVWVEAGTTFFQLADYLHARGASVGYTLTNWNISFGGSVAMGAHRSSIREDSMVAAGVLAMDIIDGRGEVRRVVRDEEDDEWLAASTSLGLLGIIARIQLQVYPDTKVYAKQAT
jgi:FAD/FMN-containing dehydrogenase